MTCILAVQVGGVAFMAGDTRISWDDQYVDGLQKVFALNRHVLVGVCGDACCVDVYLRVALKARRCTNALSAARALQVIFGGDAGMVGANYTMLIASVDRLCELTQHGIISQPFDEDHPARAGSGGPLAEAHWVATRALGKADLAASIVSVSRFRSDCGPAAIVVSTSGR